MYVKCKKPGQPRCYFLDKLSVIWLSYLKVFRHPLQLRIYLFCFLIYPFSFIVDSSSHIHSTRIQANNLRNFSVILKLLITFYKIKVSAINVNVEKDTYLAAVVELDGATDASSGFKTSSNSVCSPFIKSSSCSKR